MNLRHITALRDRQRDTHNPGATIGDCLIHQSSCPEYLVSQLTAYLAAAQDDLAERQACDRLIASSIVAQVQRADEGGDK